MYLIMLWRPSPRIYGPHAICLSAGSRCLAMFGTYWYGFSRLWNEAPCGSLQITATLPDLDVLDCLSPYWDMKCVLQKYTHDLSSRHCMSFLVMSPVFSPMILTGIEWLVHVFDLNLTTQILTFPSQTCLVYATNRSDMERSKSGS